MLLLFLSSDGDTQIPRSLMLTMALFQKDFLWCHHEAVAQEDIYRMLEISVLEIYHFTLSNILKEKNISMEKKQDRFHTNSYICK